MLFHYEDPVKDKVYQKIMNPISACKRISNEETRKINRRVKSFLQDSEHLDSLLKVQTLRCECYSIPYDFSERVFSKDIAILLEDGIYEEVKSFDNGAWVICSSRYDTRVLRLLYFSM